MAKVRSALGKTVDMTALLRRNEEAIAVSNIRMNARGDRLDKAGNIAIPVQTLSRVQADTTTPAESIAVSELDSISETIAKKKPDSAKKSLKQKQLKVINELVKTDNSGKSYKEIEYDDGSIETVYIGDDDI